MAERIEARNELTRNIIYTMKFPILDFFKNLYNKVLKENNSNRFILRDFQNALKEISTWTNQDKYSIVKQLDFDECLKTDLQELINVNRLILKKDFVEVGQTEFVFACLLNIARELWTKPFLFYERVEKTEYQKNLITIEKIICNEIKSTIRRLPLKISTTPKPEDVNEPIVASTSTLTEPIEQVNEIQVVNQIQVVPIQETSMSDESESEITESESESSFESELEEKQIKLPKKSHPHYKFEKNSLEAYGNYLNPLIFKPPRRTRHAK